MAFQHPEMHQNRLVSEKSPYLLQHAHNPVDWYPWGEEAFALARRENKPIFLSIGYSTCHWCHVMEHESFENEVVAEKINEYFVPIKVDREERPDIDHIFMAAVQAMVGQGGWPLSVFLTPDKKPFFGGTYFPPYAKWGSPGFMDLMESIHKMWAEDPKRIGDSAEQITETLRAYAISASAESVLNKDLLNQAFHEFDQAFDERFGGFGSEPKFPTPHNLCFLLRYWYRTQNPRALEAAVKTLEAMYRGGIYDHLGGGFHRYSTDRQWQIPHFEKMLYDQALLARAYLEAFQITKNQDFAQAARDIFAYVERDLQNPQGGFYSAEDADSFEPEDHERIGEKKEGSFYLWKYQELESLLATEDLGIFAYYYGIEKQGNALFDPHGEFTGKNILFAKHSLEETAKNFSRSVKDTESVLSSARLKLFEARGKRPRPHLDDKILVDWNGLMIAAFSLGARVLNEPRYEATARKAADFILKEMVEDDGRLLHRYRDGEAAIAGMVDDYTFFTHGLLELYETSSDTRYLEKAIELSRKTIDLFWDTKKGGLFFTGQGGEELLFSQKQVYDGAVPSGNSIAALNFIKLYHITLQSPWKDKAMATIQAFSAEISRRPSAFTQMLTAFNYILGPASEIVIASNDSKERDSEILKVIYAQFLPNTIIIYSSAKDQQLMLLAPFVKDQKTLQNTTTVYICENHVCKLPAIGLEEVKKTLSAVRKD